MSAAPPSADPAPLDALDRRLLTELAADGRVTNAALAKRLGIAESTCLQRVRSLRERGVVRGVHADVDLAALGFPIQAVIKVRLGSHNRDHVASFHAVLAHVPGVLRILHVGGEDDYLLHVAVASTAAAARPRARAPQRPPRRPPHRDPAGLRGDPGRGRAVTTTALQLVA